MWIIGVPMLGGDLIELGSEIPLHVGDEVAGEGLEVDHLGRFFRADDEMEVMPIITAAFGESCFVGRLASGAEHAGLFVVSGGAITSEVGDVSSEGA